MVSGAGAVEQYHADHENTQGKKLRDPGAPGHGGQQQNGRRGDRREKPYEMRQRADGVARMESVQFG